MPHDIRHHLESAYVLASKHLIEAVASDALASARYTDVALHYCDNPRMQCDYEAAAAAAAATAAVVERALRLKDAIVRARINCATA